MIALKVIIIMLFRKEVVLMRKGRISVDLGDVRFTLTIPKRGKNNGDKTTTRTKKSHQTT
jgi:hypothetical protein